MFHEDRALLDSCSEINFITESLPKYLQLPLDHSTQVISGTAKVQTKIRHSVLAHLKSRVSSFEWTSTLSVTKIISSDSPDITHAQKTWQIPNNLTLADPLFFKRNQFDLLLNSNVFFELLSGGKISLCAGLPHLFNTKVGWIVAGQYTDVITAKSTFSCNMAQTRDDNELHRVVNKFWELEGIASQTCKRTAKEIQCKRYFL